MRHDIGHVIHIRKTPSLTYCGRNHTEGLWLANAIYAASCQRCIVIFNKAPK